MARQSKAKLLKLVLPKFKGDVTKWQNFGDSFNSSIHTYSQLSQIDKFNHLHSLLEGHAVQYKAYVEGDPKTRKDGMAEWWKIAQNPRKRNGGKLPRIQKGGMAMIESHNSKTRCIRTNDNTERQH